LNTELRLTDTEPKDVEPSENLGGRLGTVTYIVNDLVAPKLSINYKPNEVVVVSRLIAVGEKVSTLPDEVIKDGKE
jgi:hypothetical protein